jgi:hypothetical protein
VRHGHSSIQVTYDRYGHLFPQMDLEIAEDMDAAFRARKTLPKTSPTPGVAVRPRRTRRQNVAPLSSPAIRKTAELK